MPQLLAGTITKIVFRNDQNGYTVLRLLPEGNGIETAADGTVTVVGNFASAQEQLRAQFTGDWIASERFGKQFKAAQMALLAAAPASKDGGTAVDGDTDTITGVIAHITFYNPDNGWSVLQVEPDGYYPGAMDSDGTLSVVGVMPEVVEGETARFTGKWVTNAQYGKQFKAQTVIPLAPQNEEGITRYIAENVIGIGERTAKRIYNYFGDKTLEVLDENPERIHDVPDLRPQQKANFIEAWSERRAERQIMIHLQSYGITARTSRKIYDKYKEQTLIILKMNPYVLADDVEGIGFKKADAVALGMGIASDAPFRLRAGLEYALGQLGNEGHTFAPRTLLLDKAVELLNVPDKAKLEKELNEQMLDGRLYKENLVYNNEKLEALYLPMYFHSERGAAQRLRIMQQTPSDVQRRMKQTNWTTYLSELAERNAVALTELQQSAVQAALTKKVSVLTGGPGTGKTTTLQMVIHALEEEDVPYALASPTGRAAKRLSEATEREASTIHRLLGWGQEGFEYDDDNPLKQDFLIIDEASMIDLVLFYNLLKAIKPTAHLMLVGDVDQLPSVGAGNVLNDVIGSGIAHVTRLSQIFRQVSSSHIITNAHRINNGDIPFMENNSEDFFFFNSDEPTSAAELVVDIVQNRLEKKLGDYNRLHDVQVIAPMYRGQIGVDALNQALQRTLNPPRDDLAEKRLSSVLFRRGDKVMQTKNNYDKEVFNGDIGFIRAFNNEDSQLEVVIDGRIITYDYSEAEQLIHAFCISTHRSQGSEYPVVVMPLMTQHYMMLQRNLLYTAITRAKRMVVLVGQKNAVAMAVKNNRVAERYSGLIARLMG